MGVGDSGIVRVAPPLKKHVATVRILIGLGLASMGAFLYWFIDADHVGYKPVFVLLTFALAFKLLKMLHEWYHYWSPSVPAAPPVTRRWTVDVLTTACPGEPREMIIRTLRAMQAISYPHTSYLCDEGDEPELKRVCNELGVIHVTRKVKVDAKAGNINNALKQATGEICVVLDPDHVPVPEFLDRVLPYFEDDGVGYVQCVQAYGNQEESFIARGAAEQTYHFYGPMMMCMNTYGTAQAIGANCTFRRKALDSIGGHAAGLSEDMHTAMQLHAKGWRSVYIPEILTRGLVPATLSSYYKQQLKWSRGTFELLFRTYPKLFKNFTWRQKLHYFTLPFYFLYGFINLIDIVIPIIALCTAQVPWEVDVAKFGSYFVTLCLISCVVRLYAQRWLLEKHEAGFHLCGGILRTATWWIFLIGLIYTILKIRVPYIPTPKEDEHRNYLRLSLPNIGVILACATLVPVGLHYDYTPYSMAMASYSLITVTMLAITVVVSQQKFVSQLTGFVRAVPALTSLSALVVLSGRKCQQTAYQFLRNGTAMIIGCISLLFLSYSINDAEHEEFGKADKELGGFYLGVSGSPVGNSPHLSAVVPATVSLAEPVHVFTHWLKGLSVYGSIPFVSLKLNSYNKAASTCAAIIDGKFDRQLEKFAGTFRAHKDPVFISCIIAGRDNIDPSLSIRTWQYLYTYFNSTGISNLTWVWHADKPESDIHYPGPKFTDWISVPVMASGNRPFSALYEPFRKKLGKHEKPVIAYIGCKAGRSQTEWYREAFSSISSDYREINGVLVSNSSGSSDDLTLTDASINYLADADPSDFPRTVLPKRSVAQQASPDHRYHSEFVKGTPGHFTLQVNGKPVYIRGVAYNTAHDWRDGNMPLTRRQVEKDFAKIREMGANTIRRYSTGIYDHNVLNIARESGLSVLFGFWFDPKVDFFADSSRVEEYMREVQEKVEAYKDNPAVLAWSIGNETWGLLKHRYAKPYLVKVRRSYLRMVEQLAGRIHAIDPTRPVFSCIEHEEYQIAGELVAFRDEAPSLDAIGVNSYYRQQISKLNHIAWQFDSLRPYLVSEFGPEGYWDPKYNRTRNSLVIEQSEADKAAWYTFQWDNYVQAYKGFNIGGVAYCWHDRMEGSLTWFGLSDFRGRLKPSYFALKKAWCGSACDVADEYQIDAPEELISGQTYTFAAKSLSRRGDEQYEWMMLKDNYLDRVDNVDASDDGRAAVVTVPETPSEYRLYLYVTHREGDRVTTASVPIKVKDKRSSK
jgi:cellulose synthase (UDP-forming)